MRDAAVEESEREAQVARAISARDEQVARQLAERVVERERELRSIRAELERERERGADILRSLAQLTEELEAVRRSARGQATRMRLRALRDAVELGDRMTELKQGPGRSRERLLDSLQAAIQRLSGEEESEVAVGLPQARSNGHFEPDAGAFFEGMVEVEIGPLNDFSQLVGFEDAAQSIAATSEISVERFSGGRATLAVNLKEPVELLRELEERCDLEFEVRDLRRDRLILDVGNGDSRD